MLVDKKQSTDLSMTSGELVANIKYIPKEEPGITYNLTVSSAGDIEHCSTAQLKGLLNVIDKTEASDVKEMNSAGNSNFTFTTNRKLDAVEKATLMVQVIESTSVKTLRTK